MKSSQVRHDNRDHRGIRCVLHMWAGLQTTFLSVIPHLKKTKLHSITCDVNHFKCERARLEMLAYLGTLYCRDSCDNCTTTNDQPIYQAGTFSHA